MCKHTLHTYPCGHHRLIRTWTCEHGKVERQLAAQLDTKLPSPTIGTAKITGHELHSPIDHLPFEKEDSDAEDSEESMDEDRTCWLEAMRLGSCNRRSCDRPLSASPMTTASRLLMSIYETQNAYEVCRQKQHNNHLKLLLLAPTLRRRMKRRTQLIKGWGRVVMSVERRLGVAKQSLYGSLAGDVSWLYAVDVMPKSWQRVVREVHFARAEMGALRWRVEGKRCGRRGSKGT